MFFFLLLSLFNLALSFMFLVFARPISSCLYSLLFFQRVSDNLELMHAVCVNMIMSINATCFAQALFTNVGSWQSRIRWSFKSSNIFQISAHTTLETNNWKQGTLRLQFGPLCESANFKSPQYAATATLVRIFHMQLARQYLETRFHKDAFHNWEEMSNVWIWF